MSFQTHKTQIKIFLMKSDNFLTLHRQQWNWHVQAQKGSQDVDKIVHVTSLVSTEILWSYENTLWTLVKDFKVIILFSLHTKSILIAS